MSCWPRSAAASGPAARPRRAARPAMVPSLVPVSLRAAGEENIYENRVSVMVADLPVHLAEPAGAAGRDPAEMAELKAANEAAAEALISLGRYTPYSLASLLIRAAYRLPQREIVTVTTNVPGPAAAAVRNGPQAGGDHPLRADRHHAAHRSLDLQLLRSGDVRDHRRLRHHARHRSVRSRASRKASASCARSPGSGQRRLIRRERSARKPSRRGPAPSAAPRCGRTAWQVMLARHRRSGAVRRLRRPSS